VDVGALQRGLAFITIALALFATVDSLRLAVTFPWIFDPAWTRFQGVGQGANIVCLAALVLLPQGHRARPWMWVGVIGGLGYVVLALIARSSNPA
jgi:hypothetical protein